MSPTLPTWAIPYATSEKTGWAQLRARVQVVSAPQLFPTPAPLAARMVGMAGIMPGHAVLEPSAGTGRILEALDAACPVASLSVTAAELNHALAAALTARFSQARTICRDFLECGEELETFDRILMNPPFVQAQDIDHIRHALTFLKPAGNWSRSVPTAPGKPNSFGHSQRKAAVSGNRCPLVPSANPAQGCMPCC